MKSLCTCVFCVCACPEIFFFCALKQRGEDAAVAAQGRPSRLRLFFLIYIFRKKKNEKRLLLMLKRRRRLLLLLSFFQCILRCPDSFLLQPSPTLVLLPSTRLPFLFFSFFLSLVFFFFPYFSLFLLLSLSLALLE